MIRTPSEYRASVKRHKEARRMLALERKKLAGEGLTSIQIKRILEPTEGFIDQIKAEIASYDQLKKGRFSELHNLEGIGQLLVGLRIAMGLTQRELARRLGVHETQVSRDERSDYYGITAERINRILIAMGVELHTSVKRIPLSLRKSA